MGGEGNNVLIHGKILQNSHLEVSYLVMKCALTSPLSSPDR